MPVLRLFDNVAGAVVGNLGIPVQNLAVEVTSFSGWLRAKMSGIPCWRRFGIRLLIIAFAHGLG